MNLKRIHHLLLAVWLIGPGWAVFRAVYFCQKRMGWRRWRMPVRAWKDLPLQSFLKDPQSYDRSMYAEYRKTDAPSFFFHYNDRAAFQSILTQWDQAGGPMLEAEQFFQGRVKLFRAIETDVGSPPRWNQNPISHETPPHCLHWSDLPDFAYGDIRTLWEINRFGWVYVLVRAYWRTGDERYVKLFWQWFEDWRDKNSPNAGANWKCGQEASIRVTALCFGLYAFAGCEESTALRIEMLAQAVAFSAKRIERNFGYALSQNNNHPMSEAMGLLTVGTLFPELKHSRRYVNHGRRWLERLALLLVYHDGAFSQHSFNYHRLMLSVYLWSARLCEIHGEPLSQPCLRRIESAFHFLLQMQCGENGETPNYGQNDGSELLPLSNQAVQDVRPALQPLAYLFYQKKAYANGGWDEPLLWLFGAEASGSDGLIKQPQFAAATDGGYFILRSQRVFIMTRCAAFRHRPHHADQLHAEIWWKGQPIAVDPGTISYNSPPPWDNPYIRTDAHNTVTVDQLDQMERASRFLWLPWAKGQQDAYRKSNDGRLTYWQGRCDGYRRLADPVDHIRAILLIDEDAVVVVDRLVGKREHVYQLHWRFYDHEAQRRKDNQFVQFQTAAGRYCCQIVCDVECEARYEYASSESSSGWRASWYQAKAPAHWINVESKASALTFCTVFSSKEIDIRLKNDSLYLETSGWSCTATYGNMAPLFSRIVLDGALHDQLNLK